jgi:hypothetical protein
LGQIPAVHIRDGPVVTIEFQAHVVYIGRPPTYRIRRRARDKRLPPTRVLTSAIGADALDHGCYLTASLA